MSGCLWLWAGVEKGGIPGQGLELVSSVCYDLVGQLSLCLGAVWSVKKCCVVEEAFLE